MKLETKIHINVQKTKYENLTIYVYETKEKRILHLNMS